MDGEPFLQLDRRVRIVQPRELLCPRECGVAVVLVHADCVVDERVVKENPGVIDGLVEGVGIPLGGAHRKPGEPLMDRELNFDVATVVLDELRPAGRVTARQIPRATTVEHGGRGGYAELLDQLASCAVFLHVKVECGANGVEAHRQPQIGRPDHGAPSLRRIKKPLAPTA